MAQGNDLGVGAIGLGLRSMLLAKLVQRPAGGVRIHGGADPRPEARGRFAEEFGKEVFVCADHRDLLARPDIAAVLITSPDYLHEQHAIDAIHAGKHVYLEKPMATTVAGCDRILQAASASDVRVYVGHNMRHMAFVRKMKGLIDSGAIGEVKTAWCRHFISYGGDAYYKDWHADRRFSMGLLVQKACHDLDVLMWLCGGRPVRVHAMGSLMVYDRIRDRHGPEEYGDARWSDEHWPPLRQTALNPVIDVEDVSVVNVLLDNGVLLAYQQCHFTPDAWRNYTFIGTEGRIENHGDFTEDCVIRVWNQRTGYKARGDLEMPVPQDSSFHGGADELILDEFVRYVREGGAVQTSLTAARDAVAAACLATQSLRQGGVPLDVPAIPPEVAATL
ncbi:MAG: Gfo/Idh/MocA family oxidoreductase [Phycisphaerae bacterium]|nr:Gfo/Idh/MocA family oxidoreductase [Phycisphaerae bacterium]